MARKPNPPINPLGPEHHDVIVSTLETKSHLPASFALARANGVNTAEMEAAYEQANAGLTKILQTYFPNGRNSGPQHAG